MNADRQRCGENASVGRARVHVARSRRGWIGLGVAVRDDGVLRCTSANMRVHDFIRCVLGVVVMCAVDIQRCSALRISGKHSRKSEVYVVIDATDDDCDDNDDDNDDDNGDDDEDNDHHIRCCGSWPHWAGNAPAV